MTDQIDENRVRVRCTNESLLRGGPDRDMDLIFDAVDVTNRGMYLLYAAPGTPQAEYLHPPASLRGATTDGNLRLLRDAGLPETHHTWLMRQQDAELVEDDPDSDVFAEVGDWVTWNGGAWWDRVSSIDEQQIHFDARIYVASRRFDRSSSSHQLTAVQPNPRVSRGTSGLPEALRALAPEEEPETFSRNTAPNNVLLVSDNAFWIKRNGALYQVSDRSSGPDWYSFQAVTVWDDVAALGFTHYKRWTDRMANRLRRWSDLFPDEVPALGEDAPTEDSEGTEDTIDSLRAELAKVKAGLQIVEDRFWDEAIRRRWCGDAEVFVRAINEAAGWTVLRETRYREQTYDVDVSVVHTIRVTARDPEQARGLAHREARRQNPESRNVSATPARAVQP